MPFETKAVRRGETGVSCRDAQGVLDVLCALSPPACLQICYRDTCEHGIIDAMKMKKCCVCKKDKLEDEFYFVKNRGYWMFESRCKSCNKLQRNKNNRAKYERVYRKKYPEKLSAKDKVRYAIKKGLISRKPCEVCKDIKSQGHHDDYSKPLEVRWLCSKHHRAITPSKIE